MVDIKWIERVKEWKSTTVSHQITIFGAAGLSVPMNRKNKREKRTKIIFGAGTSSVG
jgi:hypothetical protein